MRVCQVVANKLSCVGFVPNAKREIKSFMGERLTIELVPRTCWYSNVRSNVSPEEWERLKRITFKSAGYRCEICGGRGPQWPVECHEIWLYDDLHRIQKLGGLLALCPACHEVKHIGLAGARGRAEIAVKHLAQVNEWDLEAACLHVDSCFEVWSQRSEHQWQLDISFVQIYELPAQEKINL